ncbi:MAG: Clp protease N-terminal domain-containing protein [Candidatus Rokuibacteriota bacterium]
MLKRFTDPARRAVVLATEEARSRRHETVGPEHLLMGILQVGGNFTVHYLEQLGVSPETLRAEAERVLGEAPGSATSGEPAFSPELKAVLEVVLTVKRRCTVDPDLLLLALLADEHSAISGILHATGADLAKARWLPVRMMSVLRKPVTEEEVGLIATSRWRVQL